MTEDSTANEKTLYNVHQLCEHMVSSVLKEVNTIQYLIRSIEEISGKPFSRDRIKCLSSPPRAGAALHTVASAGYMWSKVRPGTEKGDIVMAEEHITPYMNGKDKVDVSAENLKSLRNFVERNIRHELIHAFDDVRGVIEPANCMHQACSEIRAARLSGDCFAGEEIKKGRVDYFQGGIQCVRRRATLAVESNPICRGFADRAVETTFAQCYSDYEPFVAPVYSMGSYGDVTFDNSTLKL
ncbi:mitochondrial inner membrane protease ATP23 [Angomonas deanei]|uniref:Mitochondrial inner membrane protease ATP23 n=1 Tax=Angomonas deanei TaxID=59799 RepID=S9UQE5_9TRYP|nr:mitochondrial inner membrane protease ATP23 [Angomonas deanei]EPY37955.1 mitochondrial inner membrane protease ATP23 [Angomonas deanei]EPY38336.1 mitochondrial inner membrane protease ATP23 [Angomonas deanei]CAD2214291.1 Peptidase M76 family, putative [Angomonas deanei]|eukprot:EPY33102.1 mitochondrial inner membrane protease ATP23 [Angomonas deanei]